MLGLQHEMLQLILTHLTVDSTFNIVPCTLVSHLWRSCASPLLLGTVIIGSLSDMLKLCDHVIHARSSSSFPILKATRPPLYSLEMSTLRSPGSAEVSSFCKMTIQTKLRFTPSSARRCRIFKGLILWSGTGALLETNYPFSSSSAKGRSGILRLDRTDILSWKGLVRSPNSTVSSIQ